MLLAGRAIFWGGVCFQWNEQFITVIILGVPVLLGLGGSSFFGGCCWLLGGYRRCWGLRNSSPSYEGCPN